MKNISLLLLVLSFSSNVLGQTYSASGFISLPGIDTAPTGGLEVNVELIGDEFFNAGVNQLAVTTVIIPEGQNSESFSLSIPDELPGSSYKIQYRCFRKINNFTQRANFCGTRSQYYFYFGSHASNSRTSPFGTAKNFSRTQVVEGVEIELIEANTVEGVIHLPSGMNAGETGFSMFFIAEPTIETIRLITGVENSSYPFAGESIVFEPFESSMSYFLTVPKNEPIKYVMRAGGSRIRAIDTFEELPLFPEFAIREGGGLTFNLYDQEPMKKFINDGNKTGVDVQLVRSNKIAGTINAPNGGNFGIISLVLSNASDTSQYFTDFVDLKGTGGQSYDILFPEIEGVKWLMNYDCIGSTRPHLAIFPISTCRDYFPVGYYADQGTVNARCNATELPGDQNIALPNIGLKPISTRTEFCEDFNSDILDFMPAILATTNIPSE